MKKKWMPLMFAVAALASAAVPAMAGCKETYVYWYDSGSNSTVATASWTDPSGTNCVQTYTVDVMTGEIIGSSLQTFRPVVDRVRWLDRRR